MSDLHLSSQNMLRQALTQLNTAASGSPVAKQAAAVIVQHLSSNQLSLTGPKQDKPIVLEKGTANQALSAIKSGGKAYAAVTVSNQQASLQIFGPQTANAKLPLAELSNQQLSQLLQLPLSKPETFAQKNVMQLEATVKGLSNSQLQLVTPKLAKPVLLDLPKAVKADSLAVGMQVKITINLSKGTIALTMADSASTNKVAAPTAPSNSSKASKAIATIPINTVKPAAAAMIGASLLSNSANAPVGQTVLTLSTASAIQTIKANPEQFPKSLQHLILDTKSTQLNIIKTATGVALADPPSVRPIASIPLTNNQVKQLLEAGIPRQTVVSTEPTVLPKGQPDSTQRLTAADSNLLRNTLNALTALKPENVKALPPEVRQLLQQKIDSAIRQMLPKATSISQAVDNIQTALGDKLMQPEPAVKESIQNLRKMISQALQVNSLSDPNQIKQMLSSLPSPPVAGPPVIGPTSSQGLAAGLITLLQLTLANRTARDGSKDQSSATQRLASILGQLAPLGATQASPVTPKTMQDIHQWEQKHQLLRELGRLFAGQQHNKLFSIEQQLQGQDNFYFTLPTQSQGTRRDIELLIRREEESQQHKDNNAEQATWHLTMKLDVGETGEILSKVKLRDSVMELDLYTSNEATLHLVLNYLPLLKKRLQDVGIEIAHSQCQLGKIPDSLQQRPYQIFETQA